MSVKKSEDDNPIPRPASEGNGITDQTGSQENINAGSDAQQLSVALFHDIPVRIVKHGRDAMFPVVDIAMALDYSRQALRQIIVRNSELFAGYRRDNVTLSEEQPFNHICLSRDGVIILLTKLDYKRIKDPAKRQRIIEFQRWAAETLGKVMDGTIGQQRPWTNVLQDYVAAATMIHDLTGIDRTDAVRVAISLTQKETGVDLSGMVRLIDETQAAAPAREWVSTEKLARLMNISVRELNTRLALGGFLGQRYGTIVVSEKGRKFVRSDQPGTVVWDTAIIPEIPSYWKVYDD